MLGKEIKLRYGHRWLIYSYLLLTLVLSSSCSDNKIQRIEVSYLHFLSSTMLPVDSCYKVFHYDHMDTVIRNQKDLEDISKAIGNLKVAENNVSLDLRIACLICMENGDTNRLCLNTRGGIKYNKVVMQDSEELFYIFNKLLYADSISKSYWSD